MATARLFQSAVLLDDGRVLVAGGDTAAALGTRSAEIYDPASGTFSPTGSMVVARTSFAMVKLSNGKVLAAGGYNDVSGPLSSAEVYDPGIGAWSAVQNLAVPRNRPSVSLLASGRVLVAGGYSGNNDAYATAEQFDPATNAWSAAGAFTGARFDHSDTALPDGRVLIAGGYSTSSGQYATDGLYDAVANTWASAAPMNEPRSLFGLSMLASGKVLATGGDNLTGRLSSAEVFDPQVNAWTRVASMASAHYFHTATALANGKVLVVAGLDASGPGVSAELYDPVTNRWSPAGALQTARYAHTATLLRDGRVLVAGGGARPGLAGAELWTPTTSLTADPAVVFGDQTTGASTGGAVQITNTGDSPLLLADFALAGAAPGDFGLGANRCAGAVAPGATCVLDVAFAPTAAGARSATLTFSANTQTGTFAVTLSGRGLPRPPVALRRMRVTLAYDYQVHKRSTRFSRLVVKSVPSGSTVTVTCTKKACKRYIKHHARGAVALKRVIRRPIKAGAAIRVAVAHGGYITAVKRLTVRAGKRPRLR
jgi:hypothetical protein